VDDQGFGGAENVREAPEQQSGGRSRKCDERQTSYPGSEVQVTIDGKVLTKRVPSLAPASVRDQAIRQDLKVNSEELTQKIVWLAEKAAKEAEDRVVEEDETGDTDVIMELMEEARNRLEARRLPLGRPHEFTRWGDDMEVKEKQGVFQAAVGREAGYSLLTIE